MRSGEPYDSVVEGRASLSAGEAPEEDEVVGYFREPLNGCGGGRNLKLISWSQKGRDCMGATVQGPDGLVLVTSAFNLPMNVSTQSDTNMENTHNS